MPRRRTTISHLRRGRIRRAALACGLGAVALAAGVTGIVWRATRPLDAAPAAAVLAEPEPDRPIFEDHESQVTFILQDDQGQIPTLYLFAAAEQKGAARAVNTLRGTPNERGVEVHFEAIRFRRDDQDPAVVWARAVGIANESEGKTPIPLDALDSGQPVDLQFSDEINVPLVAHVVYSISLTVQYERATQILTLTHCTGSIRWKMLAMDAFDESELPTVVHGRKGQYPEKPVLNL